MIMYYAIVFIASACVSMLYIGGIASKSWMVYNVHLHQHPVVGKTYVNPSLLIERDIRISVAIGVWKVKQTYQDDTGNDLTWTGSVKRAAKLIETQENGYAQTRDVLFAHYQALQALTVLGICLNVAGLICFGLYCGKLWEGTDDSHFGTKAIGIGSIVCFAASAVFEFVAVGLLSQQNRDLVRKFDDYKKDVIHSLAITAELNIHCPFAIIITGIGALISIAVSAYLCVSMARKKQPQNDVDGKPFIV